MFGWKRKNKHRVSHKLNGPKRKKGESFTKYKKRLRNEKKIVKQYLKGELVWWAGGKRSWYFFMQKTEVTYKKNSKGEIISTESPTLSKEAVMDLFRNKAQGTLKGMPTGRIKSNGMPERAKPRIVADREEE